MTIHVLVFAVSKEELNVRRQALLKQLQEKNVSINCKKSVAVTEDVVFLSHRFSKLGIQPDPKLVEIIGKVERPKSLKEVENFLGLFNFCGNKIKKTLQRNANH